MVRYSLFVLNVPLNPKQTNNIGIHTQCALHKRPHMRVRVGLRLRLAVLIRLCTPHGPPLLNERCTSLIRAPRLRNDLYCVAWDVKLYYTIPYHVGGSVLPDVCSVLQHLQPWVLVCWWQWF